VANETLGSILKDRGVAGRVIIPPGLAELLDSLNIVSESPPQVQAGADQTLLGFASLNLEPFGPKADYTLETTDAGSFQIDLTYLDAFKLPAILVPATVMEVAGPDGVQKHLKPLPQPGARVQLKNVLTLRIQGESGGTAGQRIVFPGAADALVPLQCDPPAFLWGSTGFGLHLPDGLVVDDSASQAPDPPQHAAVPFASQSPAWRGISIRNAELYLPASTPLIGKTPIPVDLELGSPAGMDARTEVVIPAEGKRPAITATVEWHDPTATTLAVPPTMVELVARWQIEGGQTSFDNSPVRLAGGNPLIVRARYTRDVRDSQIKFNLAVEGGGEDGLVSVTAEPGDTVPKIFVTATALATAIIADAGVDDDQDRDASGTTLHLLLVAAKALSSRFTEKGRVVVHGVELEGNVAQAGALLRLRLDYSVDVVVKEFELGAVRISMNSDVPMRIRYRNVLLEVDFARSGLEMFRLSFAGCSTLVEDPGGWLVQSPGSLLDIIGTRSGHGSTWFEVDLRFALDLGPVKVSGATIRATFESDHLDEPLVELRGLQVEAKVPGVLTGEGQARITEDGFDAGLGVKLDPLNVAASGFLRLAGPQVLVDVRLDLPGPIPLANSGLGLFGMGGLFVVNGKLPEVDWTKDVIEQQLKWKPRDAGTFVPSPGGLVLGLGAVLGTLPDLGYAFSTKATVIVAVPDVTVRAALDARFVSGERARMADIGTVTPVGGLRVLGLLVANKDAVALALRGTFQIPVLLCVEIPVSAFYPSGKSDWYLHVGSDGIDGRGPGPVRATVLPDLVNMGGYAYLMLRGNGIPNLGGTGYNLGGFSLGMGFGFDIVYPMGIVWLEMSAQAVIGIATDPFMFIGKGGLQGTLHLGPFSLGVSADVKFQIGPEAARVLWLMVCGEVDLWFTTLRGCVEVGTDNIQDSVPDPKTPVLQRVGLTDWHGRELAEALAGSVDETPPNLPVVWPDVVPVLEFVAGPKQTGSAGLLKRINRAYESTGDAGTDELKYAYSLSALALEEFKPAANTWSETQLQPVPFWGAWQVPKQNPRKPLPGARQLALLSGDLHHWMRNLVDGGRDEPDDPVASIRNLCRPLARAVRGWALGKAARPGTTTARWHLPAEGSSFDPFYSYFDVDVMVRYIENQELEVFAEGSLFAPDPLDPGGPIGYPQEFPGPGHSFTGALALPHVASPDRERPMERAIAHLTFTDELNDATIALLVPTDIAPQHPVEVFEHAPGGITNPMPPRNFFPGPPGFDVVEFVSNSGNRIEAAEVHYQVNLGVQLAGVSGLAQQALQKTRQANDNASKGAAGLDTLKNAPPGGRKPMLKPDTTYRLRVTIDRTGQRKNQPVQNLPAQEGAYYFKTAPLVPLAAPHAHFGRFELLRKVDTFDPKYLERYIAGWTPFDKATYWFRNDLVAVHFDVDYIAELVDAYDHEIVVRAVRTDTAPGAPDAGKEFFKNSLFSLNALNLMNLVDVRLVDAGPGLPALAAGCGIPTPGASLGGVVPLAPNAQYDLAVVFPKKNSGLRPREIPGIHFSSSRYLDLADLLGALGFRADGRVAGDVPVNDVPDLHARDGDRVVEDALDRLGLGQWPHTVDARTTALWLKIGDEWRLRGVLMEAPEPIERFDPVTDRSRLHLKAVSCGGQPFDQVLRNASRSRLLYLASQPFVPHSPLALTGSEVRPDTPIGGDAATFSATSAIASIPAFVEDLT
jgi:hypothetical protein